MAASQIRVVVRTGADALIGEQRRDLRRRGRVAVWAMAPALGVVVIAQILRLTRSKNDAQPVVLILLLSLAILGTITAWFGGDKSDGHPPTPEASGTHGWASIQAPTTTSAVRRVCKGPLRSPNVTRATVLPRSYASSSRVRRLPSSRAEG